MLPRAIIEAGPAIDGLPRIDHDALVDHDDHDLAGIHAAGN
jgi:hypothetical protein